MYDAEIWELLKIDHKTLQISECGPRETAAMFSRADRVKNGVFQTANDDRNIVL